MLGPVVVLRDQDAAVSSIVQARLDELPDPVKTMLTYAAAGEGRLDLGLLARIQCVEHDRLVRMVDGAVDGGLAVWRAESGARIGGHCHLSEMVDEVLLDALTPSSRQSLHAVIAREFGSRVDTVPARRNGTLRAVGLMAPTGVPGPARRSLLDHEH
ncbi:hypothetical protein RJT17_35915 [Streptomyces sp. P5-A9]|uniref:hypothetical protein n=1 Tax=Streptomyces sp. P5-A9 TaxID=3071730 RepID=UPI002FC7222D